VGAAPVPVFSDRAEVGKVVLGLGARARDVMPKGGRLVVGVGTVVPDDRWRLTHPGLTAPEYAVLTFGDSGAGIEPGLRERVFEPFLPVDAGVQRAGLVLAEVHGIARQNGGAVDLASETPGGTTFRLYLPVARTTGRATPVMGAAGAGAGATALLVEAEASPRAMARSVLERHGCDVIESSNGADALAAAEARRWQIDLLVTGEDLPGMNGTELTRRLSARVPGLRVVSMGAPGSGSVAGGCHSDTASMVTLFRPFSQRALVEAVAAVLGAGRSDS
jgi:CheY-like chemotaxis protein